MKKQIGLYLPEELHVTIINRANMEGRTISDTYITLIEYALTHKPVEPTRPTHGDVGASNGASPLGRMVRNEHLALAGLRALQARSDGVGDGAFRFDHEQIAAEVGLLHKLAYSALQSLKQRGLVGGVIGAEADRWGRPINTAWWLPEAKQRDDERRDAARLNQKNA